MEDKEKDIIDFGKINVPSSWDDITLEKYQRIEEYYDTISGDSKFNIMDVLDIMIDKDKDYIMSLPSEFVDMILDKLSFLQTPMEEIEPSPQIEINKELYTINLQNKLKTGEYIAADTVLKTDKHNYASILAILCRKEGEIYDSKFENEILEHRIKMFEKQPITKIMPIIAFFLNYCVTLQMPTLLSSKVEEAINLTRSNIENSAKDGEISKRSMRSLMKKLSKLEKSIKSI